MKLDISAKTYEPKWVEFDGCDLLLAPYPVGRTDLVMSSDMSLVISGKQRKEMFMYSVQDWKNIEDVNGVNIPCTEENKAIVFDYNLNGMAGFVYTFNSEFDSTVKEEYSNLQHGQDGTLKKEANPALIADEQ